jgi:hypothetical protein
MPEIEEAQTLLAALTKTDEVKTAAAARLRRLKLQTSYGQAMIWSKGYAADPGCGVGVQCAPILMASAHDPERDRDATFRFGQDAIAAAFTYLGFTNWVCGQVGGTGARMEEGLVFGRVPGSGIVTPAWRNFARRWRHTSVKEDKGRSIMVCSPSLRPRDRERKQRWRGRTRH